MSSVVAPGKLLSRAHLLATALACGAVVTASSGDARAATAKDEAHAAYERGLAAHARGDEAVAADEFAQADSWVPSDAALEAAIESAERASDAVRVVRLVLRGEARTLDGPAQHTLTEARRTYLPRVALLEVECAGVSECTLAVGDGAAVDAHAPVPIEPGSYRLHVRRGDASEEATADVRAGQVVTFAHAWTAAPSAPSASPAAANPANASPAALDHGSPSERSGWIQPIAWTGIGITAVLAGIGIASGIDTASKHADFVSRNCGAGGSGNGALDATCAGLSHDGQSAQTRTDWILAGAALAGAATVTFILFEHPFGQVDVGVGPREARLTLHTR